MPTYCPRPFDTLLIDEKSDCYVCECENWLPIKVGNINDDSIENILQKPIVKKIQDTIIDQSYSLCDLKNCMIYHTLDSSPNLPKQKIKKLVINIDRSCNLACPSCRKHQYIEKDGAVIENKIKIVNKILDYLNRQNSLEIRIGGDGDIFASQVYRYLLETIEDNGHHISLQTNGLLLQKSKKILEKISSMLQIVCISFDASTSDTYKKIRSPGDLDVLQKNVRWFIDNFPSIKRQADFVVQSKNLYELLPFIEEKSKMFDIINLQKITDWNTDNNFKQQAIWKKEHHQYNDFVNLISIASEYPKVRINNLSQYVDKTA